MSLDIFQSDQQQAFADASKSIAPNLPATFDEAFDVAWRQGTEFHNSVGYAVARDRALNDYRDYVFDSTGERLPSIDTSGGELQMYGGEDTSLNAFNAAQSKIADKNPSLNLTPLSTDDIDTMTRRRMAKAHDDASAMSGREKTWGGTAGTLSGILGAGLTDPVILATLPLGGGEAGVALRALEFAGIGAGTEAAISALSYRSREAAVPGSSKEIPGAIVGAAAFGGLIGGAFGMLGKLLKAGERPLATSTRDDLNIATSEAQIATANVFPTSAGEIAGRDALTDAVTQAVRGEPITAGNGFDASHVAAFAESVGAHDAETLAVAGERSLRPLTIEERPDVEAFARIPNEGETAAAYWGDRLAHASPEERAALGAADDAVQGSRPLAGVRDLTPEERTRLAADPSIDDANWHNLEHILSANPEADFTIATRLPDGTYRLDSRKLADVMKELDETEIAGKELLACVTGMMAAE